MNLLTDAPVVAVQAIALRTLYVVIEPAIGSPLYNSDVFEECINEYLRVYPNFTGWRAFMSGNSIEIYLHGNIDWEAGSQWL